MNERTYGRKNVGIERINKNETKREMDGQHAMMMGDDDEPAIQARHLFRSSFPSHCSRSIYY